MKSVNINMTEVRLEKFKSTHELNIKLGNTNILFFIFRLGAWDRNYKQWNYEECE